jgi:hypothetical protein
MESASEYLTSRSKERTRTIHSQPSTSTLAFAKKTSTDAISTKLKEATNAMTSLRERTLMESSAVDPQNVSQDNALVESASLSLTAALVTTTETAKSDPSAMVEIDLNLTQSASLSSNSAMIAPRQLLAPTTLIVTRVNALSSSQLPRVKL